MIAYVLFSHLCCVGAAYLAIRRALLTYIPILSTIQAIESDPDVKPKVAMAAPVPEQEDQERTSPWWRKHVTKNALIGYAIAITFIGVAVSFAFVLPLITTDLIQSCFWGVIVTALISQGIYKTVPWYCHQRTRMVVAAVVTAAIFTSAYNGDKALVPLAAASLTFDFAGHTFFPKLSMRVAVKWITSLACVTIMCITIARNASNMFGDPDKKSDPAKRSTIVPWLLEIMLLFNAGVGFGMAGAMMALTYRFEWRQHPISSELPPVVNGQVVVPTKVPRFKSPITTTAFVSVVATIIIADVALPMYRPIDAISQLLSLQVFGIPVTAMGLMLGAWYNGQFALWWNFMDEWYPEPSAQPEHVIPVDEEKGRTSDDTQRVEDLIQVEDKA